VNALAEGQAWHTAEEAHREREKRRVETKRMELTIKIDQIERTQSICVSRL
jgi:hypothetical protein